MPQATLSPSKRILEKPPTKAQAKGKVVMRVLDKISHAPLYVIGPLGELITACVLGSGMTKVEYANKAGVHVSTLDRRMKDQGKPKGKWHGGCLRVVMSILRVGKISLVCEHE